MANEWSIKATYTADEPDKMTLDGAIAYYEREAKKQHKLCILCPWSDGQLCDGLSSCKSLENGKNQGCIKLSHEYDQLVYWLKDYRNLRNPDDANTEQTNAITMDNSGDTDILAEPHEKSGGYWKERRTKI